MELYMFYVVLAVPIKMANKTVKRTAGTSRPVTSLGHQSGRRIFWEGPKFFKVCPTHFSWEAKKLLGVFSPPSPPWLRTWMQVLKLQPLNKS